MIMGNVRLFKFNTLMLFGLLIIGCSKDDDNNGMPEYKEEQEQVIMDNAAKVETDIMPIFEKAESAEEMVLHLDEIMAMENVEDAWKNDESVSVKIKDGGIITWCFFPKNGKEENMVSNIRKSSPMNGTRTTDFALCEKKNACIINAIPYDQLREMNNNLNNIADLLGDKGYGIPNIVEGEDVTIDFLCKRLPNYGVSILFTHGDLIKGQHWIMTGTTYDTKAIHEFNKKQAYADTWPELKMFLKDWQSNKVQLFVISEVRNDKLKIVTYLAISETFLNEKITKSFPSNSLMFAIACSTLKNNPSLWNVFDSKGLGCFFGYDNTVSPDTGIDALTELMETMLNDFSTASEGFGIIKKGKVDSRSGAQLKYYPDGSNVCLMSLCPDNNHPHAIDLGLPSGTKWACCNVGASSPEGCGGYFAWGEIEEMSAFDGWTYYKYYDWDWVKKGKSTPLEYLGDDISGTQYDVAHVRWGKNWRMPNIEQCNELVIHCTYKGKIVNGIKGEIFVGPNNNAILFPYYGAFEGNKEGWGIIWSSSLVPNDEYNGAYCLHYSNNYASKNDHYSRCNGYSIRPVIR